jgi:type IV pilus assembly protein PilA
MKNKGFSLVELIIVIAIMAILAAAIAPALIRYIDKSRRSDDVAAAETINTGVQAALANEEAYDEVQGAMPTNGANPVILATASVGSQTGFTFSNPTGASGSGVTFISEINSSCGGKAPKIKYTKGFGGSKPSTWLVGANEAGKPVVWLGTSTTSTDWELQPDICASYK